MISYFLVRRSEYVLTVLDAGVGAEFVTSDQPALNTYTSSVPAGIEPEDLEFFYPITPTRAVLVGRGGERAPKQQLSAESVDGYNQLMARAAEEQLFATNEALLLRIVRER
jgi:hypothetical protein